MASNDPTDTGGLFVGRRPGTAPLRYRGRPAVAGERRRRADRLLAAVILVAETLLLMTLWGPQPAAWVWVASNLGHELGSMAFGYAAGFVGMACSLMTTLLVANWLDDGWQLVRRAGGHDQRGALERVLLASLIVAIVLAAAVFLITGSLPSLPLGS